MSLRITPLGPSAERAALAEYLPAAPGWTWGLWALAGGDRWLTRSCWEVPGRRRLEQALLRPGGLVALDHTLFTLDAQELAEHARYHRRGGPNLHPRPIVLPATLGLGERHHPLGGEAWVALAFCGVARLALGERAQEAWVLALEAAQGPHRQVQWMLAGVGELALGPAGGAPQRWLVAATGPGGALLGGVPAPLQALPWPELPEQGPDRPQDGLL